MTHQEIFDTILFGIRAQGKPSTDKGKPMYRGPDGLKCAIGLLIADEHYSPELEDLPMSYSVGKALEASGVPIDPTTVRILRRCQQAHDFSPPAGFLDTFNAEMGDIALDYNLEYTEP